MVVVGVLTVILSSFGFAEEETPSPDAARKYNPFDMMLGFTGGAGLNMKGDALSLKEGYFILDAYAGANFDVYLLNWLSVSTGLYFYEVMAVNLKEDLSQNSNLKLTDMMRTPFCLTLPLQAHINMPGLEWLYLGMGMNFNIPLFSLLQTSTPAGIDLPDTKGDPYLSLPIDIGIDITMGGKFRRLVFRITPHFIEPDTLVTFGIMFQNNIKISGKK